MRLLHLAVPVVALGCLVTQASAVVPPPPLDQPGLYAFPGSSPGGASAVSAGLGLADAWLGDEPSGNPAASPARGVAVSPVFLHVSRQDLRAGNRNFDESAGSLDLAGGRLALPVAGCGLSLYAWQPVLRLEDNAFTRGLPVEGQPAPAVIRAQSEMREWRAGLALSRGFGRLRLGVAGEWTSRNDSYDEQEISGDPLSGTRHADFTGDGFGFQAGVQLTPAPRWMLGAALRRVPALDLSGGWEQRLQVGETQGTVSGSREAGWEGGLAARFEVTPAFRVLASLGGGTQQEWAGFGVAAGPASSLRVGLDYHDAETPWTLRFGLGRETIDGVPEPSAGVVGLGFGWTAESFGLDLGLLHRSLDRAGKPTSYEDRVIATVSVPF